ncbi:MAG: OmpA family protein [Spirochaetales bacterium]|nr:OmpA family protein [Spirochaetales bacterium]
MADDKNLISSETHEINYVLKKWEKKQNKKNRQIVRETLEKFRDDITYKPHNRENFYRYVEDHDILALLEDAEKKKAPGKKADKKSIIPDIDGSDLTIDDPYIHKVKKSKKQKISIQDLSIQRNTNMTQMKIEKTPGTHAGKKASKKNLIITLIVVLGVILFIVLFLVGRCLLQGTQTTNLTTSSGENQTEEVQPQVEVPPEENTEPEKIHYTATSLKSFLETCTPLYFKGDLDILRTDEESKIDSLVSYLDNYILVELSIEGHTANMGKPKDEMELSIKRARLVADMLKKRVKTAELKIKTTGYGAKREAVKNPDEETMKLNRRVEIIAGEVRAE